MGGVYRIQTLFGFLYFLNIYMAPYRMCTDNYLITRCVSLIHLSGKVILPYLKRPVQLIVP